MRALALVITLALSLLFVASAPPTAKWTLRASWTHANGTITIETPVYSRDPASALRLHVSKIEKAMKQYPPK